MRVAREIAALVEVRELGDHARRQDRQRAIGGGNGCASRIAVSGACVSSAVATSASTGGPEHRLCGRVPQQRRGRPAPANTTRHITTTMPMRPGARRNENTGIVS